MLVRRGAQFAPRVAPFTGFEFSSTTRSVLIITTMLEQLQKSCIALAFVGMFLGATPAPASIILSEYVEGSGNNKAIELYNTGPSSVDLDDAGTDWVLEFYFNGSTLVGTTIDLTGIIGAKSTYVIADNDSAPAILSVADQQSVASFFNGDDAIVLRAGGVVIDSLGRVGEDPGSGWTGGGLSTANRTLRRKTSILTGDTIVNDAFDPSVQWVGFPQDTFSGLGGRVPEPTSILVWASIGLLGVIKAARRQVA